jgi:predicted dithiol-disulfide oxidoreductase (DUF899 family)
MSNTRESAEKRYEQIIARTKEFACDAHQEGHQLIDRDFSFKTSKGSITLKQAFQDKDDLIVIHNMGTNCSWCTMWADGFNGVRDHLSNRSALLLLSPDPPEVVEQFAKNRGWGFPVASARDSGLNEFIQFGESNNADPGFSTFYKDASGAISRISTECFGDFDLFSPVWHMIARLKNGVNDWEPQFDYNKPAD